MSLSFSVYVCVEGAQSTWFPVGESIHYFFYYRTNKVYHLGEQETSKPITQGEDKEKGTF